MKKKLPLYNSRNSNRCTSHKCKCNNANFNNNSSFIISRCTILSNRWLNNVITKCLCNNNNIMLMMNLLTFGSMISIWILPPISKLQRKSSCWTNKNSSWASNTNRITNLIIFKLPIYLLYKSKNFLTIKKGQT
jgi:hypothetical protein